MLSAIKFITIFLIFYHFNICVKAEIDEREKYDDIHSNLPHLGSYATIVKLRAKRQTPTESKNQYRANETNTNPISLSLPATTIAQNNSSNTTTSLLVPYIPNDRQPLGYNGAGQRKDPINDGKKLNSFPKKTASTTFATSGLPTATLVDSDETIAEKIIDTVDVPENDTISEIGKHNLTVRNDEHHNYYNSTIYVNPEEATKIWNDLKDIPPNTMLSGSHRRAMTVNLNFDFPFYGHPIRNITVATGGFLYTGDYVHSWLAATQYIAPLMANFDTSLGNDSFVRLYDNQTAFTVIWENVYLQDRQNVGKFTFSTTLHNTGDIVFTYFSVPIDINSIVDDKHPVKVGLSDAYIFDKVVFLARRKTIYEYHRINLANTEIKNATIIRLTSLLTCLNYTDCESCVNHKTTFDCVWCPTLSRCSTGTDRRKQDWLARGCDNTRISETLDCPAIGKKGNNAAANQSNGNGENTETTQNKNINSNTSNNGSDNDASSTHPFDISANDGNITGYTKAVISKESRTATESQHTQQPKNMGMALGFLVPLCLVVTVLFWVLYAYRNPHTKSGQLLIQFRPSQWSWRRGEARYTAATIHM